MVKKNSFLFSDINRTSQHAVRYKKQHKKKLTVADERRFLKTKLLSAWSEYNVVRWADAFMELNKPRFTKIKTIKKFCLYSGRMRSVNQYNLSKYKVSQFTKMGVLRDVKKY
jgi:hypothetical protein